MNPGTNLLIVVIRLVMALGVAPPAEAQTFGTVRGTVLDPSDAVIQNATVEIQNPVVHDVQTTKTNREGKFEFVVSNKRALYNFLSTFSGTHYVTPGRVSGTLAFHF